MDEPIEKPVGIPAEIPAPNRRKLSHTGLLESAIRAVAQIMTSSDPISRSLAGRVMADLQQLRHDLPIRRQQDRGRAPVSNKK